MTLSARVSVRIDPAIRDAEIAKLKPMGLTLKEYIRLVFTYVVREQKLPPGFVMPDETKSTRRGGKPKETPGNGRWSVFYQSVNGRF